MQDSVPAHTFANPTDKHACFNKTERNNEAEAPDLDFTSKPETSASSLKFSHFV